MPKHPKPGISNLERCILLQSTGYRRVMVVHNHTLQHLQLAAILLLQPASQRDDIVVSVIKVVDNLAGADVAS